MLSAFNVNVTYVQKHYCIYYNNLPVKEHPQTQGFK